MAASVAVFHLAYALPGGWGILAFPFALLPLLRISSSRRAFYTGLTLGFALYAPPLGFFWTIFGPPAVLLWGVLAFWVGVFLALGCALRRRVPRSIVVIAPPLLWTGIEYFRAELYPLRFTWLTTGFALQPDLSPAAAGVLHLLGIYGVGTVSFAAAALFWETRGWVRLLGLALVAVFPWVGLTAGSRNPAWTSQPSIVMAGAQIEAALESEIPSILDQLLVRHPEAAVVILPEYSLSDAPNEALRTWCRENRRFLVVGGRDRLPSGGFRNTAFVVGPDGTVVFTQAKSVPIQFFDDGMPAERQALWRSPWGPIGIAVCYDLSYSRVMDRLVAQGAGLLIIPTMDAWSWGVRQHALHARVAPLRAAEYGVPIVRVASSGISQWVDPRGIVTARAPFSESTEWMGGRVTLVASGRRPLDRWLAPVCSAMVAIMMVGLSVQPWVTRRRQSTPP